MPPRRTRRRRKPAPRSSGYLDTATRALAVAYAVRKLINVEFKNITTTFAVDPNSTGLVTNLTAIAQGDDVANRDGNKVRAKHIVVSGTITLNSSATNSRVRYVIVRDNNGSTTIPAITDLYGSVAAFALNQPKLGTPQSNSRFSVLMDKMLIVNGGSGETKAFSWSSTLDHHIFFTGSGATDEGKGHMYLFQASNEATNDPVAGVACNVKFLDN